MALHAIVCYTVKSVIAGINRSVERERLVPVSDLCVLPNGNICLTMKYFNNGQAGSGIDSNLCSVLAYIER